MGSHSSFKLSILLYKLTVLLVAVSVTLIVIQNHILNRYHEKNYHQNSYVNATRLTNIDIVKIEIMIPSFCSVEETKWRSLQRDTWIQWMNKYMSNCDISYHYFIGDCCNCFDNEIQNESKYFNDIIILQNHTENWDDLQMKTLKMILYEYKYIYNNFPFDLLLKLDSDTYLNIPLLCNQMKSLNQLNPTENALYFGHLYTDQQIFLPNKSYKSARYQKYYNLQWYQHLLQKTNYLPYMDGSAYILSLKSVQIIHNALYKNLNNIAYSRFEDTYIGQLLLSYNVQFVNGTNWFGSVVVECDTDFYCIHKQHQLHQNALFNLTNDGSNIIVNET